ncbi:MAG: PDZ domain-containing protein [Rhizomicrobium sp.]
MVRLWLAVVLVVILGAVGVARVVSRPPPPQGYSGLEFANLTGAAAARAPFLKNRGALVANVADDSPAARAGIEAGAVIAAIDGVPIISARTASRIVRAHKAGDRVRFMVIEEARGAVRPKRIVAVFAAAPKEDKKVFTVEPFRTLAKEIFNPPGMAANAAWSRRIAHGPSIRPLSLMPLNAGRCAGLAPEDWRVADSGPGLIHLQSKDGGLNVLYKLVPLTAGERRDPEGAVLGLVHAVFHSRPTATPGETNRFEVHGFNFGNRNGIAGLAFWRLHTNAMAVWIAGVPAGEISWALPLAAASLFSLECKSPMAPSEPRDPSLSPTSISSRCLGGDCRDSDFAATYLAKYRLGYVHGRDGQVFLVDPRRDFWQDGGDGPGFYRQIGGENEKLVPGRSG